MNLTETIVKYFAVIILGGMIFWVDSLEVTIKSFTVALILVISFFKSMYFVGFSMRKIVEVSLTDTPYYKFLVFMATTVFLIIISFSIDFFCLSEADSRHFAGIRQDFTFSERYFDLLYFSILNFTNFGYDQIYPKTGAAKFLISMELILSFTTVIFILSDFMSLRDSLSALTSKQKNNSNHNSDQTK